MISVVGSANIDLIASVPTLPSPGETVLGTSLLRTPGGKGANQAVAAARAGSSVTFIGRVGNDENGRALRSAIESSGVGVQYLTVDEENPTGLALITVDDQGENEIVVIPGANSAVSEADIEAARKSLEKSSYVILQLEIPLETVRYTAGIAPESHTGVILNAAPARAIDPKILRNVDILVANQHEIATLTGMGMPIDPATSAGMLLDTGVKAVILTLGTEGAVIVQRDTENIEILAFPATAIDSTGAGDTFVGNLAHALDSGHPLVDAARFASAAAALSVQKRGAQPSMPAGPETEAFLIKDNP